MEIKEYKAYLLNENERDYLCLDVGGEVLRIDLNSDDQTHLREVFIKILKHLLIENFEFKLTTETYDKVLFLDISKDYVGKLNS